MLELGHLVRSLGSVTYPGNDFSLCLSLLFSKMGVIIVLTFCA